MYIFILSNLCLVIGGIILFVVPELVNSVKVLTDNAPSYINRLMQETTKLLEKWNVTQEQINALKLDWSSILTQATQVTTNFMGPCLISLSMWQTVFSLWP